MKNRSKLILLIFIAFSASLLKSEEASLGSTESIEREFTFYIVKANAGNTNCLYVSANESSEKLVGCSRMVEGKKGSDPGIKAVKLPVFQNLYNHLRLTMKSKTLSAQEKVVFDSFDVRLTNDLNYHVNSQAAHSIDLWLNDGNDDDYHDLRTKITGPTDIQFGIDYLIGTVCSTTATEQNKMAQYSYFSKRENQIPMGLNLARFKFATEGFINLGLNLRVPVATLEVLVPSTGRVLNHKNISVRDLAIGNQSPSEIPSVQESTEIPILFIKSPHYSDIQFRLCVYNGNKIKVKSYVTRFDPTKPFNFYGVTPGVIPLDPRPNLSGKATVMVDFSQLPRKTDSLNGMMIGLTDRMTPPLPDGATLPSPSEVALMIKPLKHAVWRTFPNLLESKQKRASNEYAEASGLPLIADLMNLGKYFTGQNKGKQPFQLPEEWAETVKQLLDENHGKIDFLDVWNEPEVGKFWPRQNTPNDLFAIYKGAAQGLKMAKADDIKLGGPSLNNYVPQYLQATLDYALKHGLKVNFLAWHELQSVERDLSLIEYHLRDAKERFMNPDKNPRYKELDIQHIQLNEVLSDHNKDFPGERLATLFYAERGGAKYAAQDCWFDPRGNRNARNGSVCGLFIEPSHRYEKRHWFQPRNIYWSDKSYADVLDERIPCQSSNRNIICFAGAPNPKTHEAKIVLGYYGMVHTFKNATVDFSLSGLEKSMAPGGLVRVKIEKIPTDHERPMPQLPVIREEVVRSYKGQLKIRLPDLMIHEGAVITLNPLPSPRVSPAHNSDIFF